jgi:hypothetical protein
VFPAAWAQRHARERLGLDSDEIDGGHYISLSRPREFADRLAAYAADTHRAGRCQRLVRGVGVGRPPTCPRTYCLLGPAEYRTQGPEIRLSYPATMPRRT